MQTQEDEKPGAYVKRSKKPIDVNPYADQLLLNLEIDYKNYGFVKKDVDVIDHQTGEVNDHRMTMGFKKPVDPEKFVKIFVQGMAQMFEIPKGAMRVLSMLLREYRDQTFNQNLVYLSFPMAKREYEYSYSQNTFMSGLNRLIKDNYIYPSTRESHYYLNPEFFFNGNRLTFVQEYFTTEKSERKKMNELALQQFRIKQQAIHGSNA